MPDHWQSTTLGEVVDVVSDRVNPAATEDALYVGLEHLVTDQRRLLSWGSTADVSSSTTPFRPGDTLFGRLRPYLRKGCVVEVEGVCTPEILVVRSKGLVDDQFVGLLVLNDQVFEECVRLSAGSRMPRTSAQDLKALSVLIPSLPEQRRITDLVESIDTYIHALESHIEATRTARVGLLSELLSNPGDDWQETTLDEISQEGLLTDGDWVESKDQDQSGGNRLLQLADVGDGVFLNKSDRWLNDEQFSRLNCTPVEVGDILIARMPDPIARACQVPEDLPRSCVAVDVAICRPPQAIADPKFLIMLINDWRFRSAAKARATGTTRKRVSRKNLAAIEFNLPSPVEQRRIVDLIGSMDEQIAGLESQVAAARETRSGVLSELLSGERLLTDDYEVAVGL